MMSEELISQNAGKILLEIYLHWKSEDRMPHLDDLVEKSELPKNAITRALKYCAEKGFVDLAITRLASGKRLCWLNGIVAQGIDVIEKPSDEESNRLFNLTFNFNNEFNVESIIKGEVKAF